MKKKKYGNEFDPPLADDLNKELMDKSVSMLVTHMETEERREQVDHPRHYNAHPSGVECIDVVEHMSFNLGNAMKYIWRAGEKGKQIEDLKKAVWYLNREIERISKEK